ncbi:MAG: Uma2 family endonuclease, partial [Planctomycetota bacterium]|nr:Uma2 family endonuclease [Planctomycetota bacterium]
MEVLSTSRADSASSHNGVQVDSAGSSAPDLAAPANLRAPYELSREKLITESIRPPIDRGPNELFARLLWHYQLVHPEGWRLDATVGKRQLRLDVNRHRADRLIWAGLGRPVDHDRDVPTIVVEFILSEPRDGERHYERKCREFFDAGVREFWRLDRFARELLVVRADGAAGLIEVFVPEDGTYETPLLP